MSRTLKMIEARIAQKEANIKADLRRLEQSCNPAIMRLGDRRYCLDGLFEGTASIISTEAAILETLYDVQDMLRAEAEEQKDPPKIQFRLDILEFPMPTKIDIIKEVRSITGWNLKASKDWVEGVHDAPRLIAMGDDQATEWATRIEAQGAILKVTGGTFI